MWKERDVCLLQKISHYLPTGYKKNHERLHNTLLLSSGKIKFEIRTPEYKITAVHKFPAAMSSTGLNFVLGRLIFMGHPCGTSLMSPFRFLEFRGSFYIFGKLVHHCNRGTLKISPQTSVINFSLQYMSCHFSTAQVTPFTTVNITLLRYCMYHAVLHSTHSKCSNTLLG